MEGNIQHCLKSVQYVTSFTEFEKIFNLFTVEPFLSLQKLVFYQDPVFDSQYLERKIYNIKDTQESQNQSQITKIFRGRQLYFQYEDIGIYKQISSDQNVFASDLQIIKESYYLNLIFHQEIDGFILQMQLKYKLLFEGINQNQIKELKSQIQKQYQQGQIELLFKGKNYCDYQISTIPFFIKDISQDVVYDTRLVNKLIAKIKWINESEVELYRFLIEKVYKKEIYSSSIKTFLKNPKNLTKQIINVSNNWEDYIISPKLDGVRGLFILLRGISYIVFESQIVEILNTNQESETVVLEAEIYQNVIYAYDLHYYNNSCIHLNYLQRLDISENVINTIQQEILQHTIYSITLKKFTHITKEIAKNDYYLQEIFSKTKLSDFPLDGIIFNTNQSYFQQKIFKWKPQEKLTIDFLAKEITQNQLQIPDIYKRDDLVIYGLFCTIDTNDLNIIQTKNFIQIPGLQRQMQLLFQPSQLKQPAYLVRTKNQDSRERLENRVVECLYDNNQEQWKLYRIREDKDTNKGQYGNYYTVAMKILESILNPINFQDLYQKKVGYFKEVHDKVYNQMTRYINQIKQITIVNICDSHKNVLDLASGKGQDLFKYIKQKTHNIICIDKDQYALKELQDRFKTYQKQFKVLKTNVFIKQLDLNDRYATDVLQQIIKDKQVSFINCNLAIHYFIANQRIFDDVFSNFKGIVSFSFLNGQRVFEMLQKTSDVQLTEGQDIVYQYQKNYNSNVLQDLGLKIMIKLPFNINLMEEIIFSPNYLETRMKQSGFECICQYDMGNQQVKGEFFKQDQLSYIQSQFNSLNSNDKFHVSLYSVYIFKNINSQESINNIAS